MTQAIVGSPIENEVHLWCFPHDQGAIDDLCKHRYPCLSPVERERHQAITSEVRARQFLIGRILLRTALAHHFPGDPADFSFGETENGKLVLVSPKFTGIDFSLSHSRDETVLAVARAEGIGVDIEHSRRGATVLRIAGHSFPVAEQAYLATLDHDATEAALALWVLKESTVKATGSTIWSGLRDVSLSVGGQQVAWLSPPPLGNQRDWMLMLGSFRGDYRFAVALWRSGAARGGLALKTHLLGRSDRSPNVFLVTATTAPLFTGEQEPLQPRIPG